MKQGYEEFYNENKDEYKEEFEKFDKELDNFEYIPVLSQEDREGYKKGHVHKHYLDLIDNLEDKPLVYFCGWNIMIEQGRGELKRRDFEMMKDIRVEIFG